MNIPWQKGFVAFGPNGVQILSVEENGRKFWSYRLPGEFSLTEECNTFEEAMTKVSKNKFIV